jgi:hypothetical protein
MLPTTESRLITSPYNNDPTNRWLPNISNAQHHSMRAISATKIKSWASCSPSYWEAKYVSKRVPSPFEVNKAFVIGTIAHMAILEPEKFESTVVVCDLDQRTNAYKDWLNEKFGTFVPEFKPFPKLPEVKQEVVDGAIIPDVVSNKPLTKAALKKLEKESEVKGTWNLVTDKNGAYVKDDVEYFVVTPKEMAMLRTMQKNVAAHKVAGGLLKDGVSELSGVAEDPETGLYLNIRGDWKGNGYFIDVKTTETCDLDNIQKSFTQYGYAAQHAQYLETANLIDGAGTYEHFAFLYVAKQAPHEVVLVKLDPRAVEHAIKKRRQTLREIAKCQNSGVWPSIDSTGCLEISLPEWYYRK